MNKQSVIWAVVPAHNEEEIITQTIRDLATQTLPVKILVVLDNCTDNTPKIVRNLIPYYPNLYYFKTKSNNKKKAGAINQALASLHDDQVIDALLIMDADTRIAKDAVEYGWKKLKSEPKTAAVCSRAGVLPYRGKNFFMRIFHMLQRLEYSDFDSQRVETLGAVKVVHGMAAIHRWSCFKEIGGFDDDNLVEDYDLTLRYKEAGYAVTVELLMNAWTEVPLLFKEWWRQRLRWYRGGVETLKSHGWNESTKMEIVQHFWVNFLMLFQWYFLFIFFYMLARGTILMHGFVLIVILLSMFGSLYRLKYLTGRKRGIAYVLRLLVFPEMIYGLMNTINLYHAYYNFFFKKEQAW